ncbi:MAG: cytochrome c maturation protein CcmE [Geminicoccaceae bacterium]|nr:cytochrome c maturation protein CcmE [Geminicoccaceae bacterium]MCX8101354.1 cytochrome c maturation protein CcmE [Geminicoccaceae bacterium]MDW8369435.1 cytochrome c maturation protein CcmE [Geminicoccaceae bacterium]
MRLRKRQRLVLVALVLLLGAGSAALVLAALGEKVSLFVAPSDLAEKPLEAGKRFRLGGLVAEGSVERRADGEVRFAVTDGAATVTVAYRGILPDLFREGQGIVAQGTLEAGGLFRASEVLAKHDESYMPKEVAEALKRGGHWKEAGEEGGASLPPAAGGEGR